MIFDIDFVAKIHVDHMIVGGTSLAERMTQRLKACKDNLELAFQHINVR